MPVLDAQRARSSVTLKDVGTEKAQDGRADGWETSLSARPPRPLAEGCSGSPRSVLGHLPTPTTVPALPSELLCASHYPPARV